MLGTLVATPAGTSARLITVSEARKLVLNACHRLPPEHVELADALDRVLAQNVRALSDVPPFPCSAMDGYAVIAGDAGLTLAVTGESRAGAPAPGRVQPGEAFRISTGATIPAGATAVIPQENVVAVGERAIRLEAGVARGDNVREAGEDIRAGSTVLSTGARLGAVELGAAAAAGAGSLVTAPRPRATVLCTGDELRAPGESLGPGEIHNSNAPMLTALAVHAGATTGPAQRLSDDRTATEAGIAQALSASDVVIISGGVSVGPHDHVKPALAALGVRELFWSVSLQPGKPTWFGTLDGSPLVFGLPGNPVSAVVTFSLFVAPALAAMQGAPAPRPPCANALLAGDVLRNPRRERAVRVRLEHGPGGTLARVNGAQESHILTSLIGADALAMIPQGKGKLDAGTSVALEALCD